MTQFDAGFSTAAMSAVMSPEAFVDALVRFEVALAGATADCGLISGAHAATIAEAAREPFDWAELLGQGWTVGTPLIPLLAAWRDRCPGDVGEALHYGATTQDAVDTALMLQVRDGLVLLEFDARPAVQRLAELADGYRHHVTMARTFLQPATPTTMGVRFARWADAIAVAARSVAAVRTELPMQLGGPVGDRSTFGPRPQQVIDGVAERLGLMPTVSAWHTDRSVLVDVAAAVSKLVAACASFAADVVLLTQPELHELTVRTGGSSSMSHKQNPVDAMRVAACAQAFASVASGLTRPAAHELERGVGAWHAERLLVPIAMCTAAGAVEATRHCTESLDAAGVGGDIVPHADVLRASDALIDEILDRCQT